MHWVYYVASGVLVAILSAVLLKLPMRCWNFFRGRFRADHTALYGGADGGWAWALNSSPTGQGRVKIQVTCAPSRSLSSKFIDLAASIRFVQLHFSDILESEPVFSTPSEGIRFESPQKGLENGYLWVWKSGRVDLIQSAKTNVQSDQKMVVDVLSILEPISRVADAIVSEKYQQMFPKKRTLLTRRFDWFIAVSPTVSGSDGVTRSWGDLDFPGVRPQRASSHQQAFCPVGGFAHKELRNWNSHKGKEWTLRVFLLDFLQQNGFYDCEAAIDQVLVSFHISQMR